MSSVQAQEALEKTNRFIQVDETEVRSHVDQVVRQSVEDTLNGHVHGLSSCRTLAFPFAQGAFFSRQPRLATRDAPAYLASDAGVVFASQAGIHSRLVILLANCLETGTHKAGRRLGGGESHLRPACLSRWRHRDGLLCRGAGDCVGGFQARRPIDHEFDTGQSVGE